MDAVPAGLLVACLCAAWCRSCDGYRATFEAAARGRPGARFVWIDIEDASDALAPFDLDVENFPTLAVARGGELRFLGALTPQPQTLARMLDAAERAPLRAGAVAEPARFVATLASIGQAV
ncbi:MAG TPA: thioredoxin family protein [Methylibium sp.]|uniref:thioredoxin family protein n=1 Tax=Methylibium sp. TaxID=2067992 RepID=UPI002DC03204|nr:thioredoxin family protein [Methylibium sp.]HEU4458283.1 thioredoxin family protein [Methylibium sp.]